MAEAPIMPFYTDAYIGDTFHLSTIEHGAYLLLLIFMWRNGGSLNNDPKYLASITGLRPSRFAKVWQRIEDKFVVQGNQIVNNRITDELKKIRLKSHSQAHNARAKWRKYKETGDAIASSSHEVGIKLASSSHMPNGCQPDAIHYPLSNNPHTPVNQPKKKCDQKDIFDAAEEQQKNDDDDEEKPDPDQDKITEIYFERFWNAYPRRGYNDVKRTAQQKFRLKIRDGINPEDIIRGAENYAKTMRQEGKAGTNYVAMAQTWLNQERWHEWQQQPKKKPVKKLTNFAKYGL